MPTLGTNNFRDLPRMPAVLDNQRVSYDSIEFREGTDRPQLGGSDPSLRRSHARTSKIGVRRILLGALLGLGQSRPVVRSGHSAQVIRADSANGCASDGRHHVNFFRGKRAARKQRGYRRSPGRSRREAPRASCGHHACTRCGEARSSSPSAIQGESLGYTVPVQVLSPTRPAGDNARATQTSFVQGTPLPG